MDYTKQMLKSVIRKFPKLPTSNHPDHFSTLISMIDESANVLHYENSSGNTINREMGNSLNRKRKVRNWENTGMLKRFQHPLQAYSLDKPTKSLSKC